MTLHAHVHAIQDHAMPFHVASLATLVGWVVDALPAIATILPAIWYGLLIYDWIKKRRKQRNKRRRK